MEQTNPGSEVLRIDPDRRTVQDPHLDRLIKGLVSSFREIEQKNRETEARNAGLVLALEQANERLMRFEQSSHASRELVSTALRTTAQMLDRVEQVIASTRRVTVSEEADRDARAVRTILQLQRQVISHLEGARELGERRHQEADETVIGILKATGESIASLAQHFVPEQALGIDACLVDQTCQSPCQETVGCMVGTFYAGATAAPDGVFEAQQPFDGQRSRDASSGLMAAIAEPDVQVANGNNIIAGLRLLSEQLTQLARISTPGEERQASRCPANPLDINTARRRVNWGSPTSIKPPEESAYPRPSTETVEVVASPFTSFAALSAFHRAMQGFPGVVDVQIKGFDNDRLRLAVQYSDLAPLASRLTELSPCNLKRVSVNGEKIEILLPDEVAA
ncbi:MAG: hypothetical protein HY675_03630 [Chloroflexi bacterium]|nr:hypothetical protein [Chloroflexota bacterium]